MQNLTTMNLVDVILHTRVPAGRLVDWLDQAFLLIHLDRTDRELTRVRRGRSPHRKATRTRCPGLPPGRAAPGGDPNGDRPAQGLLHLSRTGRDGRRPRGSTGGPTRLRGPRFRRPNFVSW